MHDLACINDEAHTAVLSEIGAASQWSLVKLLLFIETQTAYIADQEGSGVKFMHSDKEHDLYN